MLRAIEIGYVQREIQKAAYEVQKEASRAGSASSSSVNRFRTEAEPAIPLSCASIR